jgi:hypothetical protein
VVVDPTVGVGGDVADQGAQTTSVSGADTATAAAMENNGLYFIPQRPYLVLGTLRQQLLYPTWWGATLLSQVTLIGAARTRSPLKCDDAVSNQAVIYHALAAWFPSKFM